MYPPQDRICPMCDTIFQGYTLYCSASCEAEAKQEEDGLEEGWESIVEEGQNE